MSSAILIGASIKNLAVGSKATARKRVGEYAKSSDLAGTYNDVNMVNNLFLNSGINIMARILCDSPDNRKDHIQRKCRDLFSQNESCYLYYSGHGSTNGKGYLCIGTEEFISSDEIFGWFQDFKKSNSKLFIILDSCYSGSWSNIANSELIFVYPACSADDYAYDSSDGGLYTKQWISRNKVERPSQGLLLPKNKDNVSCWIIQGQKNKNYYRCRLQNSMSRCKLHFYS